MQFGLGSVALGVAYILTDRMLHGFLVAIPGAWLVLQVRAHLLGLTAIGLAFAYVLGRRRKIAATVGTSLMRPIGIVAVVLLAAFAVTQGAKQLHISALTPSVVQAELQATSASTTQEGSAFNTNVSLSPLHLPQDAVTVLLRPFPWEVQSKNQILASLEGMALVGFMFLRRKSIALSLRKTPRGAVPLLRLDPHAAVRIAVPGVRKLRTARARAIDRASRALCAPRARREACAARRVGMVPTTRMRAALVG